MSTLIRFGGILGLLMGYSFGMVSLSFAYSFLDQPKTLSLKQAPFKKDWDTIFDKVDTNQDKEITLGEYVIGLSEGRKGGAVLSPLFFKADQDKSGSLSLEEWMTLPLESSLEDRSLSPFSSLKRGRTK